MKIFFDTNVYVAEAMLGDAAVTMIAATERAGWRIFASEYVLDELARVLTDYLHCAPVLPTVRAGTTSEMPPERPAPSKHQVPKDSQDSPIPAAAVAASVDYLVSNDTHLLALDPYEGVRIVSVSAYHELLVQDGLLG